ILNDAEEVSDELILINHGEVIETGEIATLRKKYQTSVIELEFQENPISYLKKIKALQHITDAYLERNTLKVTAEDILKARTAILQLTVHEQWPLISFHINQASLEDMFMKAVKQ